MAYNKVQFIGFLIDTLPASDTDPNNPFKQKYLGNLNSKVDIAKRCQIMMNAVRTAAKDGSIEGNQTLKIFVAPEFFFSRQQRSLSHRGGVGDLAQASAVDSVLEI